MKTNRPIKGLTVAMLMMAAQYGAQAASLLADGDFDSLPVGTAPDTNAPAGHWFWPANYLTGDYLGETAASQFSIVPDPAGGAGNCLQLSVTESPGNAMHLPTILARSVTNTSGEILNVWFDIYVALDRGGGAIYLGKGAGNTTDRGPQLHWLPTGPVIALNSTGVETTLISSYPKGVWQTVRLEVDLARDRYNFYWSEKGQPVSVTRTNLPFRSGSIPYIDRFTIVRFPDSPFGDAFSCFDNIRVSAGEPAAVVPGQSFVAPGGGVTLGLTNTLNVPSSYQWQFNGTNLPGATSSTLALSNLTLDQSGPYSVTVSNEYELVTATPATVQVVDRITISSHPLSRTVPASSNVTFSVSAVSPLPISYQWQFNGMDLPGQTGSTLTLTNVQFPQDGLYTVVATDALRSVISQPVMLTVLIKPVIAQAPLSQSVVAGGNVTFSVEITGHPAPFLYQWRQGSTTLTNMVLSEKKAFLTLNSVRTNQAGQYRVVITNAALPTLTLNTTWNLTVLADADGDGLPDVWEIAHGLSSSETADALLDSDGDGQSNLGEYRSGTSPTNGASCLKLAGVTQANGQATVSFNAVSNQTYTVEWSGHLGGSAWSKLADVVARPSDRTENVTDRNAGEAARFYRVVTPRRP